MSELLAPLTDYRIETGSGVALLLLLVTAAVFFGLGLLVGRWRGQRVPDVFR